MEFSSDEFWPDAQLPSRYKGSRALYSSIFYLLEKSEVCCLHKLATDELWHYYSGGTLRLHLFDTKDKYSSVDLGPDIDEGQCIQFRVNRNIDFGAEVINGDHVLVSCMLSPAFSFDDHQWSDSISLFKAFPKYQNLIKSLLRR